MKQRKSTEKIYEKLPNGRMSIDPLIETAEKRIEETQYENEEKYENELEDYYQSIYEESEETNEDESYDDMSEMEDFTDEEIIKELEKKGVELEVTKYILTIY